MTRQPFNPESIPLALYVHLPWCVHKCPYCDFNSHTGGDDTQRARYLDALLGDIKRESRRAAARPLISVFIGGGTPSLFKAEEIARLLSGVRQNFALAKDAEITMEANPGTVDFSDPAGYYEAGVNRLSIGAQSFNDAALQTLGRIHEAADIERAIQAARAGGFTNVNLDLMYALPNQPTAAALTDLDAAIALGPSHISWYQLTLEPNTVFYARPPEGLPDSDSIVKTEAAGRRRLAAAGYRQYEVSAYARKNNACVHNLNYWQFGDYLAVGAGAHGKITTASGVYRYRKPAHPLQYVREQTSGNAVQPDCTGQGPASDALSSLTKQDLLFEFLLNGLRLRRGVSGGEFRQRTGLSASLLRLGLSDGVARGLIAFGREGRYRPTARGRRYLDDLLADFLPEADMD